MGQRGLAQLKDGELILLMIKLNSFNYHEFTLMKKKICNYKPNTF